MGVQINRVHCLFEQSGTFKNEFIKLGIPAEDYDIQNNFGETDNVIDIFAEIEKAYNYAPSIFDKIRGGQDGDLIMAFFPCIYFCQNSMILFSWHNKNYQKLSIREKTNKILERSTNREYFYQLAIKLFTIVKERGIRMVFENPMSGQTYLPNNFVENPTIIDKNRLLRGDYFRKPTGYWFVNFEPKNGFTLQDDKDPKTIYSEKSGLKAGICSEERSMISKDYARNFIYDFIFGQPQKGLGNYTLFD